MHLIQPAFFVCFLGRFAPTIKDFHRSLLFSVPQITPESQIDFGNYNCTATNELGSESKEFILIPAGLFLENCTLYSHVMVFALLLNDIN